jgi:hypothetical protein
MEAKNSDHAALTIADNEQISSGVDNTIANTTNERTKNFVSLDDTNGIIDLEISTSFADEEENSTPTFTEIGLINEDLLRSFLGNHPCNRNVDMRPTVFQSQLTKAILKGKSVLCEIEGSK